jgi:hypothetical protein
MTQTAKLDRPSQAVAPHEHKEGTITRTIEQYTSAVPSGTYWAIRLLALVGLAQGVKRPRTILTPRLFGPSAEREKERNGVCG